MSKEKPFILEVPAPIEDVGFMADMKKYFRAKDFRKKFQKVFEKVAAGEGICTLTRQDVAVGMLWPHGTFIQTLQKLGEDSFIDHHSVQCFYIDDAAERFHELIKNAHGHGIHYAFYDINKDPKVVLTSVRYFQSVLEDPAIVAARLWLARHKGN